MRSSRTYYEILGLPRDATPAQIRRRYKQLVRRYHPDVAADKETAHRLFLQIKEAYESLSDPVRRKAYDATLAMGQSRSTRGSSQTFATSGSTRQRDVSVEKHIRDARWAFIQRRFNEAVNHCREALDIDPRASDAYAILGDISRVRGRTNMAIKYYSYALQYNPADQDSERKLNKLIGKRVMTTPRKATKIRSAQATAIAINFIWWGIAAFLLLLIWVNPGKPIPWLRYYIPQIEHWSWNLVGSLAMASAVVGMLLSINGLVRHPDEELVFETSAGWAVVPTGIILLVGSGFFFWGAALFYLAAGFAQNSLSRSVLIVFAAVTIIVAIASVLYVPEASREVLLFGGNVSFLSMLFGWYVGSLFKPLSSI
ncbi:MAG: DnaJ domain-containing protein [Armatimonadetes bacterium]|nr:DnaJ domain-containing protein [Armatimonadota bacterium]